MCGAGIGLMVEAELGLSPWDVLHQGIADRTGTSIGMVAILVGVAVLALWIPLREPPGIGTVLNALLIGATIDLTVWLTPDLTHLGIRASALAFGVWLWGPGSGLYIGAGLGPGPRDGLMTGIARRGHNLALVRTGIELAALAGGFLLGGTAGVGTLLFAFGVGPNVAVWLPRLAVRPAFPTRRRQAGTSA